MRATTPSPITPARRGTARSARPAHAHHSTVDEYYQDFVSVLDATAGAERVACIAISATTMTAIRLAAEQPQRVSHLIIRRNLPFSQDVRFRLFVDSPRRSGLLDANRFGHPLLG
jgi:pimeloyl-ACP methyl ester carboxylesterase